MSNKIRLGKSARKAARMLAKAKADHVKRNLNTPVDKASRSSGDLSSAFRPEVLGSKGARFFGRGRAH